MRANATGKSSSSKPATRVAKVRHAPPPPVDPRTQGPSFSGTARHVADDVLALFEDKIAAIKAYYRSYKVADGTPPNTYAFEGRVLGQADALAVIDACHVSWRNTFAARL